LIEVAGVFICNNKAYLPVIGKTEVGFFWEAGPVLSCELTVEALTTALDEVIKLGNPPMRHPTQTQFARMSPVQRALRMRSWRKMAQAGIIRCVIWWTKQSILVAFSPRNAEDIQQTDFAHQNEFPLSTPPDVIAEFILQEVRGRHVGREDKYL
jgi:hypothetical protein